MRKPRKSGYYWIQIEYYLTIDHDFDKGTKWVIAYWDSEEKKFYYATDEAFGEREENEVKQVDENRLPNIHCNE